MVCRRVCRRNDVNRWKITKAQAGSRYVYLEPSSISLHNNPSPDPPFAVSIDPISKCLRLSTARRDVVVSQDTGSRSSSSNSSMQRKYHLQISRMTNSISERRFLIDCDKLKWDEKWEEHYPCFVCSRRCSFTIYSSTAAQWAK